MIRMAFSRLESNHIFNVVIFFLNKILGYCKCRGVGGCCNKECPTETQLELKSHRDSFLSSPIVFNFLRGLAVSPGWEITKSSSTFSATNISSNRLWFHQLHETIQMKSNYAWINYNHDKYSHKKSYNDIWFCVKFHFWYQNLLGKKSLVCRLSFVNLQRAKDCTNSLIQNIDMCLLYKFHQIARLVSHLINHVSKCMFIV